MKRSRPRAAPFVPALVLITGLPLVASCAAAEPAAPTPKATPAIRTDLDPLHRRFPELGTLSQARWTDRVLGSQDPRPAVPGPTDVAVDGVAGIDPARLAAITSTGSWAEEHIACGVPAELATELGAPRTWLHSDGYDLSVTAGRYTGAFYFDRQAAQVYFCTVNPKVKTDG
ncbi:hypothetical protein [Kitasatospora sp. NPDC093102]|uniref:hypothetical protein n=1 Tax=Kitasatospora sp. NPDC093102 TaxID=3155069 RepID=UPI00344ABDD5